MLSEDTGILGVKAEDKPDTQLIQAFQCFRVFRVFILLEECIVQQTDDLARLDGDFHLLLDMHAPGFRQEGQAVVFLFQIGQQDFLRLTAGALHIVDIELGEVAGDDPAGMPGEGKLRDVSLGLLERCQQGAIALLDRLVQVFAQAFLLDQHFRRWDIPVDKRSMVEMHLILKFNELRHILHAVNIRKKRHPEFLALAFLVPLILPVFRKCFCGFPLLNVVHNPHRLVIYRKRLPV